MSANPIRCGMVSITIRKRAPLPGMGRDFHGLYTSNGELYNQEEVSAAHKNLPLPSYLKVSNLDNGKAIVVRVNDRGPFHGDLSLISPTVPPASWG